MTDNQGWFKIPNSYWLMWSASAVLLVGCSSDSPDTTTSAGPLTGSGITSASNGAPTSSTTIGASSMGAMTATVTATSASTATSTATIGSSAGGMGMGTSSSTDAAATGMGGASTEGTSSSMGGSSAGGTGAGGTSAGGTGGTGTTDGMSAGCGTEPAIPSNMYNNGQPISIMAAGMQRRYILRVPDDYDNTKPYKLIIAWHQLDGNDVQMYANDYYHLLPLSGGNAIFAAPNGQKNGSPCTTTGNGDGGCGWPNGSGSDVALGDAVVEELKGNFCIDTNRIFATGWSYGGSMSYKHACERALGGTKDGVEGYIRGIAVYSGAQLSGQCTPSTPVAYYGSHGTSDSVLNYNGGVGLAQNFANANGCNWATPPQASGNHICTDIMGCMDDYPVQFCSFNGGHTPDPSDGGGQSWQYQLVWDFFDQF